MKTGLLSAIYHPLLVAMIHERHEFQQAQKGWEKEAEKDPKLAALMSLDSFIGSHVVEELEEHGVSPHELGAIRHGAEHIEHAVRDVLRGGLIYDLSGRPECVVHRRPTRKEVIAWRCPCTGLYLHWGHDFHLASPFDGVRVEGCYVVPGSSGRPTEELPDKGVEDLYFMLAVCGFRDPRDRLELPLAQEYRRYARALPFLVESKEDGGTQIDAPAFHFLTGEEPCFAALWTQHAAAVIEASLSALGFVLNPVNKPADTVVAALEEIEDEDALLSAVQSESLSLWDDYGAILVKRF